MSRYNQTTIRTNLDLETLESRTLLAGSVTLANGFLTIQGTVAADNARVSTRIIGGVDTVEVTLNRVVSRFAVGDVREVWFHGRAGNDTFAPTVNFPIRVVALGGLGNDVLHGGIQGDSLKGEGGNDTLNGRAGDDFMYGGVGNDTVNGNAGADWLYGDHGNDVVYGYAGNDNLYGGAGADVLRGGFGDDTLVSLDNFATDSLYGEVGFDSFWLDRNGARLDAVRDARPNEAGNTHAVTRFANGADRTLDGDVLADPPSAHTTSFALSYLFSSAGPSADDISQGGIGDCWLLASLAATAKISPNAIRQTVVDLGDGTFGVSLGQKFYRVDADLPTSAAGNGDLVYAQLGRDGSLWVPIVEKAFTMWRTNNAEYNAIDGGFMTKALRGVGSTGVVWKDFTAYANGQELLDVMAARLAQNKAVTVGISTHPAGAPLVNGHAYTVIGVNRNANGAAVSVLLRNPWGSDGAGHDGSDDGYVTVTAAQLFLSGGVVCWGTVRA